MSTAIYHSFKGRRVPACGIASIFENLSMQLMKIHQPDSTCRTCGVMAEYLPPKVEQVVFCKMSPLQVSGNIQLCKPVSKKGSTSTPFSLNMLVAGIWKDGHRCLH